MAIFYLYSEETFHNSNPVKIEKYPSRQDIVAISPHSDDLSVNCGGTMAILASQNRITPLLFYTGYRGVEKASPEQGIRIREEEMHQEAKILGLHDPMFLRLASYEKEDCKTLRQDQKIVSKILRKLKPTTIFLPNPKDAQPRHSLAAKLTLDALKDIKNNQSLQLFFYESVWSTFDVLDFNAAFTISPLVMAKKMRAIRVHRSQLQRTAFDRAAKNLASLRAATVPEQKIGGYGASVKNNLKYMEIFQKSK